MAIKPRQWHPGINLQHPMAQDIVLALPMWDVYAVDTVNDVSPFAHHGTKANMGAAEWAGGPEGPYLAPQNIVNSAVQNTATNFPTFNHVTVASSFRVTGTATGNNCALFTYGSVGGAVPARIALEFDTTANNWNWAVRDSSGTLAFSVEPQTADIEDSTWHHLLATYNRVDGDLYMDGLLVDTQTGTAQPGNDGDGYRVINKLPGTPTRELDGDIGYVFVWNRAFDASEAVQFFRDPYQFIRPPVSVGMDVAAAAAASLVSPRITDLNTQLRL